jgi:pyruvate dehydrogenase E1 component alpha subunit
MSLVVDMPKVDAKDNLVQLLDTEGHCDAPVIAELPREKIVDMYRLMVLTRMWNDKGKSLQRQGRLGTLPSLRGQEAASVGIAYGMGEDDWFVPAFREAGVLFRLGIPLRDQYLFWGGDERGGKIPDGLKVTNISIIVGGHLPHAVGIAYAAKYKKEHSAVICVMGDGATSEGDFHESLNMAAVMNLPVVFVIQNNGWAISTPNNRQSATETFAEKGNAYGIENIRVDGNDAFAIYETIKKYADRARDEFKPVLIELLTYRMDDHTTADDATRYRSDDEVEEWRKKDPVDRLRKYLQHERQWTEEEELEVIEECSQEVDDAVKEYEEFPKANPRDMFKYMYSDKPWHLQEAEKDVEYWLNKEGK